MLWDVEEGREVRRYNLPSQVRELAFSPNRCLLATGTYSGEVDLWDLSTGKRIRALAKDDFDIAAGPSRQPEVFGLAYSSDGKSLAAARGSTALVWDVETGKQIAKWLVLGRMAGVGFVNHGNSLAAAGQNTLHVRPVVSNHE